MIIYFSGTGNTLDLAERLAKETDEKIFPLIGFEEKTDVLGICYPVYFSGLPLPVKEFFEKYDFSDVKYLYAVANYGGGIGGADRQIRDILGKRGFSLNASFGITFPDNYIPMFALPDEATAAKILSAAYEKIPQIGEKIRNRENTRLLSTFSGNMLRKMMYGMYLNGRKTAKFYADEKCVKCGICAKNCPSKAIEIGDKVSWNKDQCYFCLACINLCPTKAIQYGNKTKNRNRYVNPTLK